MNVSAETRIAGKNSCADWEVRKQDLTAGDAAVWRSVFNDYFMERLNTRYLRSIEVLQKNDKYQGEGFSIMAILCTLIEFLETTATGKTYRHLGRGETPKSLKQYEYSRSDEVFVAFLSTRQPFCETFNTAAANDFYASVRCGLLHEARTKAGWKIRANLAKGVVADVKNKIIDRNNFQNALLEYIRCYGVAIESDPMLQEAFIRKFDSLCV